MVADGRPAGGHSASADEGDYYGDGQLCLYASHDSADGMPLRERKTDAFFSGTSGAAAVP